MIKGAKERKIPSVFLSHSSEDKPFVRELATRLILYGVKVWLDEADFFAVVLSGNSINSEWVQKELQAAMQKELSKRKVVVLPLLLEDVDIPTFLRDKVYADFRKPEKFDDSFRKLLKALHIQETKEVLVFESKSVEVPQQLEVESQKIKYEDLKVTGPKTKLTPSERHLAEFEDISITGLDASRSYNPNPSYALFNMYLKLSAGTSSEWSTIFEHIWNSFWYSMKRKAWVQGNYIVIYCVPEEIEKHHREYLLKAVEETNSKYREYLMQQAKKEREKIEEEERERNRLKDLEDELKF